MNTRTSEPSLSRSDASSLWLFIVVGAAIAVFTVVQSIQRMIELVRNTDVTVPAEFRGTTATAPIGPDGAPAEVGLDRAILTVDTLPAASVGAGILEALTVSISTVIAVLLLTLLSRELIRGRIFSARNTKLAAAAGITWVVGYALAPFFGNMVANGAFAQISERTFDNVVMAADLTPLVVAAFIAAFMASVFAVGDRLRTDAEGLV